MRLRPVFAFAVAGAVPLSLLPAAPALAANETDITPYLHGEAGIGYEGEVGRGQYLQNLPTGVSVPGCTTGSANCQVGSKAEERELIDIEGRFGAWHNLMVYVKTRYDSWDRVSWGTMEMCNQVPGANCLTNTGVSTGVESRKGLTDITLGARYAILSEARHTGDVTTWTVETSLKIPGSFSIYPDITGTSAEAPAGTPGLDWTLKTAFSKRVRFADPYVTFYYVNRGPASSPADKVGNFSRGDEWGTFFGTELVGFERPEEGLKFAADIGLGWMWVNDGQVPANRWLYGPNGDPTDGAALNNVVNEQGYIRYDGRVGFFYQLQKHAIAMGHMTYGLPGEHYIEQYPSSFADPAKGATIRAHNFTDFGYNFELMFGF